MDTVIKKRRLFDEAKLAEELESAIERNDIIARVKLDNRVRLNSINSGETCLDDHTLSVVLRELKSLTKTVGVTV